MRPREIFSTKVIIPCSVSRPEPVLTQNQLTEGETLIPEERAYSMTVSTYDNNTPNSSSWEL